MNSRLRVFVPAAAVAEADRVPELLETLAELCPRYELAVVHDDDETEAARALATCYPQVRAVAHPLNATLVAALEPRVAGDLVFAAERLGEIRRRFHSHMQPDRPAVHAQAYAFHLA